MVPEPRADEIVVPMFAAPLNPTDMALLFAFAEPSAA
jgi:NADPH:quinone reductase-like Zn-dependent oxidoreductase